jgi:hypothetical protein
MPSGTCRDSAIESGPNAVTYPTTTVTAGSGRDTPSDARRQRVARTSATIAPTSSR